MKIKKIATALAAGFALAAASTSASASYVNVGGVVWNPSAVFDFTSTGEAFEYQVSAPGDVVHGYGQIDKINSKANFCPTCELTYTFGGFTLVNANPANLVFSGGWVNFYVQNASAVGFTAFSGIDPLSAADGALWLSLSAHTDTRFTGIIGTGTLFGKLDAGSVLGARTERGSAGGLLDVTGGLAAGNFNTNTLKDSNGGLADINFTTTFLPTNLAAIAAGAAPLTGTFVSRGNSIPEPATLFLLGAGLLGLGFGGRRVKRDMI